MLDKLVQSRLNARACKFLQGASVAALVMGAAAPAFAQDAEAGEGELEAVVITGSRTIRDGSTAPTPVSVVSVEQLQQAAPKNLAEGLQALPALRGTGSTNSMSQSAASNFAGSFLNLRNLGAQRTLTLLDGRRLAPAAVNGSVNFNLIPQSLIKRVDIVTGGASAQYGSDAVAGVVNVILDTEFTGVKGLVQAGISDVGDNGNYKAEITMGGRALDDRLHFLASGGVSRSNAVDSFLHRDWAAARANSGRFNNISVSTPGSVPNIVAPVASGGRNAYYNANNVLHTIYPGALITNLGQPGGAASPILAAYGISAKTSYSAAGVPGNPGLGYKILPNGEGSPYSFGDWNTQSGTIVQGGGDGQQFSTIGAASLLETEQFFGRLSYDVSDNLQIFADAAWSKAHNNWFLYQSSILTTDAVAFTVYEDNPFLQQTAPDAYARLLTVANTPGTAYMNACNSWTNTAPASLNLGVGAGNTNPQNLRCFRVGRLMTDTPDVRGDVVTESDNFTIGFTSTIFGGWRFSGYYNHGATDTTIATPNSTHLPRLYAAADVVRNPAAAAPGVTPVAGVAAGAPVCGVLVYGSAAAKAKYAGCQPLNLFGYGNISPASYQWFQQSPSFDILVEQDVYALDFAGEPFSLPAGDVSFAVGVEHRELKTDLRGAFDALYSENRQTDGIRGYPQGQAGQVGVFSFTNQASYGGAVKVDEAYAELNVPVFKDLPLIQDLSINGAYRYTDYSLSGPVKTWKIGGSYQPSDSFRFRGTLSHDIRAPAINELYQGNVTAGFAFNDIARNPNPDGNGVITPQVSATANTRTRAVGNPNLKPEEADTITYGVVFTPSWIPGFTASLDYYDIKIEGAIALQLGNDPIIDCVTRLIASGCAAINRANGQATPVGGFAPGAFVENILTVTVQYQNLATFETEGVDLEMSYRREFDAIPGMWTFRSLLGYTMDNYSTQRPGQPPVYAIGEVASTSPLTGSNPRFRALTTIGWANGPLDLQLTNRYTGSGHSATYVSGTTPFEQGVNIDDNYVTSYTLWDLAARYKFGENANYEVFLTINNVLDQEPPQHTAWSYLAVTNPNVYDTIGRAYVTGLKFRF